MDPASNVGAPLNNLTPAEIAQQSRQSNAARSGQNAERTAGPELAPFDSAAIAGDRIQATPPGPEAIPAVRPADLTQRAQFQITAEAAANQDRTATADPLARRDADLLNTQDPAQGSPAPPAFDGGQADSTPTDQANRFQQLNETVQFLQGETATATASETRETAEGRDNTANSENTAADNNGSSRDETAAERRADEDVNGPGPGDAAGSVLPRGSTLSLVA